MRIKILSIMCMCFFIFSCSGNQLQQASSDNIKWQNSFSFSKPYQGLLKNKDIQQGAVVSLDFKTATNEIAIYGITEDTAIKALIKDISQFKKANKLHSEVKVKFFRKCLVNGKKEFGGLSSNDLFRTVSVH